LKNVLNRQFLISGVVLLALAVCLHLFFFSRGFYSIGWDESGRALDAYEWAVHGTTMSGAWLPFYRISIGLGLKVFPDLFLTPRIITFLFGLATIPAAAWLAHELFQSRKTTLLTLTLSTFFSQRLALSLAPLSDIMFIFVSLVTMALFTRWLRTYDRSALWLSALFCALASTLRFEGWVFGGSIFLVAAGYYRFAPTRLRGKDLLLFGLILFSFPVVWTVSTFSTATAILAVVADARQYSLREILRKNPLVEFALTNGFSLNLIGMVSVFRLTRSGAWRHRAIVAASFAPLVAISLGLLLIRSAQTGPSWRMIAVWSMLLMPFTARFVADSSWLLAGGRTRKVLASIATMVVLSAFLYDTFRIERNSTQWFPETDREAGRYLSDLIAAQPDTKILIESSRYFFLNILVASQHPDAFVRNSVPDQQSVPVLPREGSIRNALASQGIGFLVFRGDDYKSLLNQSPEVARLEDFGTWSVYKLAP
jgi:Dolichyl-phosphate-mannose-protein mannosyltransferase